VYGVEHRSKPQGETQVIVECPSLPSRSPSPAPAAFWRMDSVESGKWQRWTNLVRWFSGCRIAQRSMVFGLLPLWRSHCSMPFGLSRWRHGSGRVVCDLWVSDHVTDSAGSRILKVPADRLLGTAGPAYRPCFERVVCSHAHCRLVSQSSWRLSPAGPSDRCPGLSTDSASVFSRDRHECLSRLESSRHSCLLFSLRTISESALIRSDGMLITSDSRSKIIKK